MPHDHITYANLLFLLPFKGLTAQSQHVYEATFLPTNEPLEVKPPLSLHCYIEIASFPEVECKIPIAPMFAYMIIFLYLNTFFPGARFLMRLLWDVIEIVLIPGYYYKHISTTNWFCLKGVTVPTYLAQFLARYYPVTYTSVCLVMHNHW